VGVSTSQEAVREFYRLHVMTRKRHGLPPQSLSFFLHIHDEVINRQLGLVVLAWNGSRAVAGAVFFHFGKKALYKFGASEQTAQEFRGNNLVMWEGIRFLTEQGFETLHFGRTSLDNDGLRRFKLSWGADEETINYSRFPTLNAASMPGRDSAPRLHTKIFRKMPLALNRLAGTMIYPHLD
jgi:lipid II:glycine glycyltransferase (peptidoglycan interpeptide bridge formation enzyme)